MSRVASPHHFNADLDPDLVLSFNADPDPALALHFKCGSRPGTCSLFKWWESATTVPQTFRAPLGASTPPLWASTAFHGSILSLLSSGIVTLMRIWIHLFIPMQIRTRILLPKIKHANPNPQPCSWDGYNFLHFYFIKMKLCGKEVACCYPLNLFYCRSSWMRHVK